MLIPKGLSLFPFQEEGIEKMVKMENVLLADQMGLGKTIQVIAVINEIYKDKKARILIICPAALKRNWYNELLKWNTTKLRWAIACSAFFPSGYDITIINYDILKCWTHELHKQWDLIVLDECHYLKNVKSKRNNIVFGSAVKPAIEAKRKILISGTPMVNRPIEIYPALHYLLPDKFRRKAAFGKKFCDLKKQYWGQYGRSYWDYSGSSNVILLQAILKKYIMIRRLKSEVLKDLPVKMRQVIEIDLDSPEAEKLIDKEKKLAKKIYGLTFESILGNKPSEKNFSVDFSELSKVRQEIGLLKIKLIIPMLKLMLEESKKVVVFCHHQKVIKCLSDTFKSECVVIKGDTPLKEREKRIQDFQKDVGIKMFIGSIQASGVGITLTAASHVVFAEMTWVPGELLQAEDRVHRIGQDNAVLIQYIVAPDSVDAHVAKIVSEKSEILKLALDG